MTGKQCLFSSLLLVLTVATMAPSGLRASGSGDAKDQNTSDSGTARPVSSALQGTWSGAFFSQALSFRVHTHGRDHSRFTWAFGR